MPLLERSNQAMFSAYFLIALTMYTVCLLMLLRGYRKLWAPIVGVGCAWVASIALGLIGAYHGLWSLLFNSFPLLLGWQMVRGGSLGAAIEWARVETRPQPRPYAVGILLVVYCVMLGGARAVAITVELKRRPAREARMEADRAERIANAPSRENLPTVAQQPFERVLLMESVGACRPNEPTLMDDVVKAYLGKSPSSF